MIISINNIKGGPGKSTTTFNLCGEFAQRGYKTLVIDNDPQYDLTDVLQKKSKYDLYDLYTNPRIYFDDCLVDVQENLWLIPNSIKSALLEYELRHKQDAESILLGKYREYEHNFDVILIDNSPFLGVTVQNSITIADYYIQVVDDSKGALKGLKIIQRLLDEMTKTGVDYHIKRLGILRNNFDKVTKFSNEFSELIDEDYPGEAFKTIIYHSVKYKEAFTYGKPIHDYSKVHAEPYKILVDEILERVKS